MIKKALMTISTCLLAACGAGDDTGKWLTVSDERAFEPISAMVDLSPLDYRIVTADEYHVDGRIEATRMVIKSINDSVGVSPTKVLSEVRMATYATKGIYMLKITPVWYSSEEKAVDKFVAIEFVESVGVYRITVTNHVSSKWLAGTPTMYDKE